MPNRSVTQRQLARARAALMSTHAHLIQDIASRLGEYMPTARLVDLYCRVQRLSEFDEKWLRLQAVAHVGLGKTPEAVAAHARSHGDSAFRALVEEFRVGIAPVGDHHLQERLACEFAAARTVVLKVHVRNAIALAHLLAPELTAPAAVAWYIRDMDVPDDISGAVYAFAVAQLDSGAGRAVLPAPLESVGSDDPA